MQNTVAFFLLFVAVCSALTDYSNCNVTSDCRPGSYCACANSGACVSPQFNTCACAPNGYAGSYCQNPQCSGPGFTNGCAPGKCIAPNTCDCTNSGYEGVNCSTPICPGCSSLHGTCASAATCACATGWTNNNCTAPICNSPGCAHGGMCVAPSTCDCTNADAGWRGQFCNTPICSSVTCGNGGVCSGPDVCNCAGTGYNGVNCTVNINECTAQFTPCDTSCTDTIGNFTCSPCVAPKSAGTPYLTRDNSGTVTSGGCHIPSGTETLHTSFASTSSSLSVMPTGPSNNSTSQSKSEPSMSTTTTASSELQTTMTIGNSSTFSSTTSTPQDGVSGASIATASIFVISTALLL